MNLEKAVNHGEQREASLKRDGGHNESKSFNLFHRNTRRVM
jgi:hypothetical protein